ncbi:MAG: asparagine synthase (glutamine-hydrolyzing) [Acidobacteriia bacterium]|nr:asparagine synthase (glutamine-hydrolyzing) [Terriglobia bacterium]
MCGITGFWSTPASADELVSRLDPMAQAILHRGPDDGGAWVDARCGIALGHRRLSILDLSPEGHQPMFSASGRYIIVFNGEVYNFEELRKELPGVMWRGHSDTEVMLAAVEAWGLSAAVRRFVGMFAFALWDRQERRLYLVRDRIGIKPLYYGWNGRSLLFGSELKSMRRYPNFAGDIDRTAIVAYLRHNYIPAPHTIYREIYKLAPGAIVCFTDPQKREVATEKYWSATEVALAGQRQLYDGTATESIEELHQLLRTAVGLRMISDVPIGAFLSGGIDSSLVVALMQAQSARPVRTFSIGFAEQDYNEAVYAAQVARHLGTDHTELYVTPREAQEAVPAIAGLYDEPFADSSQLPTFLVSHLTRKHVTVSLSGDGGDELFAGYTRYHWVDKVWRNLQLVPRPIRAVVGKGLGMFPPATWDAAVRPLARALPAHNNYSTFGNNLGKLSRLMMIRDATAFYRDFISHFVDPQSMVQGATEAASVFQTANGWGALPDYISQMQVLDIMTYLPDDILVKVDRASMAVSLEARVPLLDHRVVEFAWRLPLSLKIRAGQSKWILRQVLAKYVPPALFDRPKMGFGIPVGQWLRGPLRDWAEDLLEPSRLNADGILNVEAVRRLWSEHLAGTHDWQYQLWNFLMLQAWHKSVRSESMLTAPLSHVLSDHMSVDNGFAHN